jgi:hypothetical protein
MEIVLLCPRWGSEGLEPAAFLEKARAAGYDGVELALPDDARERGALLEALARSGLRWVGQHWQTVDTDFAAHRAAYLRRLRTLAAGRPLLVNAHTGKDHFTFDQNRELLEVAREVEAESGVPVVHETHRGRWSFAAHVTRQYLEALPWSASPRDLRFPTPGRRSGARRWRRTWRCGIGWSAPGPPRARRAWPSPPSSARAPTCPTSPSPTRRWPTSGR